MRRTAVAVGTLVMLLALAGAPAGADSWSFETLDGDGGANGRTANSVGMHNTTLLYEGVPHVWYRNVTGGDLRHAWWNAAAGAWAFETLDGNGGANGRTANNVGYWATSTLYQGAPHLWYYDAIGGDLRHAWWNAAVGQWGFETLDGNGGADGRTSSAVGPYGAAAVYQDVPHVWYQNATDGDLRHAWWNAAVDQWVFETLDGNGGANGRTANTVGLDPSAALYDGVPHVWYRDETGNDLRHAWWNGAARAWGFETLDGNGGANGRTVNSVGTYTAATLYQGVPHVWYGDNTGGDLRHAWWNAAAGAWGFETLDGNGGANGRTADMVGYYNAVTLYQGEPHVFYLDATGDDLRHARYG